MSDVAHAEAMAGRDARRSCKAVRYVYSFGFEHEAGVPEMHSRIAAALFPQGCRSQNDVNDVRIVYNAWKYQYVLVTADKAILHKRDELAELGLIVMTDAEAVQLVEERIRERDAEAQYDAGEIGDPLPWWVGKD